MWAQGGSRPRAIRQTEYQYLYILAAVNPEKGQSEALFFSSVDTEVVNLFLKQLSGAISEEKHALLILDQAGYHKSKSLSVPSNISIIYLPPYSPELNPVENLWHYFRSHYWSNRYYRDRAALEEAALEAWESVCLNSQATTTICAAPYIRSA